MTSDASLLLPSRRAVCVFCGSAAGARAEYADAARAVGRSLARRGLDLVYGPGHVGMMGVLADAALEAGGRVVGVIPHALVARELAHRRLSELHVVDTMHQRKAMMFDLADAFIVAPGGFGTIEEAFEMLTGLQLGYHAKPIVFLDHGNFWAPLAGFLDHAVAQEVLRPEVRRLFRSAPTPAAALDVLLGG